MPQRLCYWMGLKHCRGATQRAASPRRPCARPARGRQQGGPDLQEGRRAALLLEDAEGLLQTGDLGLPQQSTTVTTNRESHRFCVLEPS